MTTMPRMTVPTRLTDFDPRALLLVHGISVDRDAGHRRPIETGIRHFPALDHDSKLFDADPVQWVFVRDPFQRPLCLVP